MKFLALFLLILSLSSCATRHEIFSQYHATLRETPQRVEPGTGRKTVVLFLVDGLGVEPLQTHLTSTRSSPIRDYFGKRLALGRSVFPSLTYPNIASILTASGVDEHQVTGNQVVFGGKAYNFEKPWSISALNQALSGKTVFATLAAQNRNSVSIDHYFHEGATSYFGSDIKSGIAYASHYASYVDQKSLSALKQLLERTDSDQWPEFIFVHLVDLDSQAHEHGPRSREAKAALRKLDRDLGPVFNLLKEAERGGKKVVSLLTSDHGFIEVRQEVDLDAYLKKVDPSIFVQNQHRVASLYFPLDWSWKKRSALMKGLAHHPAVGVSLARMGSEIEVESRAVSAVIRYRPAQCPRTSYALEVEMMRPRRAKSGFLCPEAFDDPKSAFLYPYFVSSVAQLFNAAQAPAAMLVAAEGTSFTRGPKGEHGGPTAQEMVVPILLRNARLADTAYAAPTRDLLSFVKSNEPRPVLGSTPAAEGLRTSHLFTVASPINYSEVSFRSEGQRAGERVSPWSPGLDFDWRQGWSQRWGSAVGYRADFYSYDASPLQVSHEIRLGASYRFGESDLLTLDSVLGQRHLSLDAPKESVWVPELDFGKRGRIFSFGVGDLLYQGEVGLLFPAAEAGFGYLAGTSLIFERAVGRGDVLGFFAGARYRVQSLQAADWTSAVFKLGISYSLSVR